MMPQWCPKLQECIGSGIWTFGLRVGLRVLDVFQLCSTALHDVTAALERNRMNCTSVDSTCLHIRMLFRFGTGLTKVLYVSFPAP